MQYFTFGHLPVDLREISEPICNLADRMNETISDGPEKSAGLRKLLEAKDCFVRASIDNKEGTNS